MEDNSHLKSMFVDPNWKPYTKDMNDAKGLSPNRGYYNASERKAAIVIEKRINGRDFALSKTALEKVLAAEEADGKVVQGYIVLKDRQSQTAIAALPAREVAANLKGIDPREGPYGAYWWINETFRCPGIDDPDAPM